MSIKRYGAIQHVDELAEFAILAEKLSPRTVVEIGTAAGGLFWLLCRISAPNAKLITLDMPPATRDFPTPLPDQSELEGMKQPEQKVFAVRGNSHSWQVAGHVEDIAGGKTVDLLFIDGDHSYDGVRRDYELYSPLVRPGGLIAFHDIVTKSVDSQVDQFWEELPNKHREIRSFIPSSNCGIGICSV